jgi:hypothetical protein
MARRPRHVLVALLALTTIVPVLAVGSPGPAEGQTILPTDARFVLGVRAGVQAFNYQEHIGNTDSDYDSVGPAIGVTGSLKLIDRLRLNVDYLGSYIQEDTETWDNIGTVAGFTVNQQNEMDVSFHVFDVDVSYSLVKTPQVEWAVALGWHSYAEDFTRSNFRFLVSTLTLFSAIGPVSEDVRGQGVKIGTTLGVRATPNLLIGGGFAWYGLYDVEADNSALGTVESDGYALRWRATVDYAINAMVTVGLGYEGHYISVEQGQSAIAILPRNETMAHTFTAAVGLRF